MISGTCIQSFYNYNNPLMPAFTSRKTKASDAEKYAHNNVSRLHLGHCSKEEIEEMEGIQEGLKILNGLTLPEVKFLYNDLYAIALVRGCRNNCSHCYEDARKPFSKRDLQKDKKLINSMDFEDYKQFIEDTAELKRRLNMNLSKPSSVSFFFDADPMSYSGTDKSGNPKDISDVLELFLSKDLNYKVQFDTAGWNIKDEKRNQIAQKVSSMVSENPRKVQVCVSINPFHSILEKSYENAERGNAEKAEKLKEIYINRMSNTIYQLAPCTKSDSLYFIVNALPSDSNVDYSKNPRGGEIFTNDIFVPILLKLADLCEENKNGYSEDIIKTLCNKDYMFSHVTQRAISAGGRASEKFFGLTKHSGGKNHRIIDSNGKIYVDSDGDNKYRTELKLNFKNKDKETLPIQRLSDERTYSKEKIASIYNEHEKDNVFTIGEMEIYFM